MILKTWKDVDIAYSRPVNSGTMDSLIERYGSEEEWIAANLRYIATQWNRPYQVNGIAPFSGPISSDMSNPVDDIIQNYRYYLSIQNSVPFAYLAEYSEGNEIAAPYTKGSDVFETVQHIKGQMVKLFAAVNTTVESLDPSVMAKKEQSVKGIMLKMAMPDLFKLMEKEAGVTYAPEGRYGGDLETAAKEAAIRPAHAIEQFGLDIIRHVEDTNSTKTFMPNRFQDCIIGRSCGVHITSRNGRVFLEAIKPFYLIYDSALDDDQNIYSSFKGFIWQGTAEEVIQRYSLMGEEADMAREMIANSGSQDFTFINNFPLGGVGTNFAWFDEAGDFRTRRITCVTAYWVSTIEEDGVPRYVLFGGTCIGGRILVNNGPVENVVYDKADPSWPLSPITVFSPDTVLGMNKSPVDRIRNIQDDMDAYLLQVRKVISRDLGKNYIIHGEKLGDTKTGREIIEDFKALGITVTNGATGEETVASDGNRLVEVVDMTLDPNVLRYMELYQERKQKMHEVVSQSNITMGMQQTYIGGGTQRATIEQASNGMVSYYHGFMQFYTNVMNQCLNMAKTMLLAVENEDEADILFDGRAKNFWTAMKGIQIDAIQCRVDIEDVIDEMLRQKLGTIALALAQNYEKTGFSMLDYLELLSCRTLSELKRYFKEKLQKIDDDKAKEKLQMMMMQAAEAQKQREAMMGVQQQKDHSAMQRKVVETTPKLDQVALQQEQMRNEQMAQEQPIQ